MTKGVCLIAAGNKLYFQYAVNACMSIKYSDPTMKVCLLWSGEGKSSIEHLTGLFDDLVEIPSQMCKRNGITNYLRPKVCLYYLTPYTETIFIDSDVIMFFKPITGLFEELKDLDFTMGSRNKIDLKKGTDFQWATADDIAKATGHGTSGYSGVTSDSYNLSSEFIYFKKTPKTSALFEWAEKYFDEPGIPYKRFGGGPPDELAFQMAMLTTNTQPHKEHYLPFFWDHYGPHHKMDLDRKEMYDQFWGYSMGGAYTTPAQELVYNALVNLYSKKFEVKWQFKAVSKGRSLPERSKV